MTDTNPDRAMAAAEAAYAEALGTTPEAIEAATAAGAAAYAEAV